MSNVGPELRSFLPITHPDLARLLQLASQDNKAFFLSHPEWAKAYEDRIMFVALCQGAAQHYLDGQAGINDFDIYTFFKANPHKTWYAKRIKRYDFGDPKFGQSVDQPDFVGRRVDCMGRAIEVNTNEDPLDALIRYFREGKSETAKYLAKKAVVLLEPDCGAVVWPTAYNEQKENSSSVQVNHQGARSIELAKGFTVGDYLEAIAQDLPDRPRIAGAIHRRFVERYLAPISSGEARHGFTMMAIACLMIEALESFRQGWPDTRPRGMGLRAFRSFFTAHEGFAPFREYAEDFYTGVRCGILHQAETTLRWRIIRTGKLLSIEGVFRTINAKKFVEALSAALDSYRDELITGTWQGPLWEALRTKMERVCANCGVE